MNVGNAQRLRDHLAGLLDQGKQEKFSMAMFFGWRGTDVATCTLAELRAQVKRLTGSAPVISATECGTVACIAGHAALLGDCPSNQPAGDFVREWLDLTYNRANWIINGSWAGAKRLSEITLAEAIVMLDREIEEAREDDRDDG